MALPKDYATPSCSLSRSLEVVGERWTLLIIRDAFYGVRRFGDFVEHLGVPRAVLTDRLRALVDNGVLAKTAVEGRGHAEYELTPMGLELWPVVHGLIRWGDEHFSPAGPPRLFEHIEDGGRIGEDLVCAKCGRRVEVADIAAVPGPGVAARDDAISLALKGPHRLLEPLTG
jgi:DNA-binding HxlR family transcriptional regulator